MAQNRNFWIGDSNGKARRAKNMWIGVNGIAQQFYSSSTTIPATEFKTVEQYYDGDYYSVSETDKSAGVRIGASEVSVTSGKESYQYTGVAKFPVLGTDWTKAMLYIKRANEGALYSANIDIGLWNPNQAWPKYFSYGPRIYSVGTSLGSDYYTYGIQDQTLPAYDDEWYGYDISNLYKSAGSSYEYNDEVWFIFQHETAYVWLNKTDMPYIVLE